MDVGVHESGGEGSPAEIDEARPSARLTPQAVERAHRFDALSAHEDGFLVARGAGSDRAGSRRLRTLGGSAPGGGPGGVEDASAVKEPGGLALLPRAPGPRARLHFGATWAATQAR